MPDVLISSSVNILGLLFSSEKIEGDILDI